MVVLEWSQVRFLLRMPEHRLIQIVPRFFPSRDGIGDYAHRLADAFWRLNRTDSQFIIGDPDWNSDPSATYQSVKVGARNANELSDLLKALPQADSSEILLHFAPYGYEKRGVPLWLLRGLKQWCEFTGRTINVIFHELETGGHRRLWSSAFWVPPIQSEIIRRLKPHVSYCATNTVENVDKLRRLGYEAPELITNFSTVGEPPTSELYSREKHLLIFGRPWQRLKAYSKGGVVLQQICQKYGFEAILDVGQSADVPDALAGIPVIKYGSCAPEKVSEVMARAAAIFLEYPVALLGKSSIFASAAAHGLPAFVLDDVTKDDVSTVPFQNGVDFMRVKSKAKACLPSSHGLGEIGKNSFARYSTRSSTVAVDKLTSRIFLGWLSGT